MDKQIMVLIAIVVLVVLSGIQLVQINNIKDNFVANGFVIEENVAQKNTISPPPQVSAPSMVGGC